MILDASALIAFLKREKGGEVVAEHLPDACISSVNLAEVLHVLCRGGATSEQAHAVVQHLMLPVESFTDEQAYLTTSMSHLEGKLSLGDRACLALGLHLQQTVLTAEKSWPASQPGGGSEVDPMTGEDQFVVALPNWLRPWAVHHAERIGLPSPENYILLVVRQAWQKDYLAVLQQSCESEN